MIVGLLSFMFEDDVQVVLLGSSIEKTDSICIKWGNECSSHCISCVFCDLIYNSSCCKYSGLKTHKGSEDYLL